MSFVAVNTKHFVYQGRRAERLVDDVPLAPTKSPTELLGYEAGFDGEVVFVMPGTATRAILQIGNLDHETAKVPIDLSAAH